MYTPGFGGTPLSCVFTRSSICPKYPGLVGRGLAILLAVLARSLPGVQDVIVGNEPNLNRFWLPQFGPAGEDVAAPAYVQLLAQTYDALKAVSPAIRVWGGAVSPRGGDRPNTGRDTPSPT